MKVRFWGVRGSIPVPGAETSRYGGNTSCLEIMGDPGHPLVLDCGTGARALGRELVLRHASEVEVLFTHFHMDHLFGFPFFGPIFAPNMRVNVGVPAYGDADAQDKLGRYLNGVYHPLRLNDIAARIRFDGLRSGKEMQVGPYEVLGVPLNHPGGSCGYRVRWGGKTVVHLTDTAPLARPDEGVCAGKSPPALERRVIEVMEGADLVIMDTMFTWDEYLTKMTWGHAYPEYAVKLGEVAGAKRMCLFHHAPDASDDDLDRLAARWAEHQAIPVFLAREGMTVDLSGEEPTVSAAQGGDVDLEG